jgi:transcriptional regulator with XRE-family HTH domain
MPIETMDLDGFLKFLKEKQGPQSDRKFAQQLGVSPSYLSDVYNGRTVPGESITAALAARRSVVFHVEVPEGKTGSSVDSKKQDSKKKEKS